MNNDNFKFRVWDVLEKQYIVGNGTLGEPRIDRYANLLFSNGCSSYGRFIIEQCTGLKDKNGTLGYHKDRYINEFGVECVIEWDKDKWVGKNETGIIYNIASWFDKCEIIGNIHEKASQ
jgi:hypothetical protein